MKKWLRKAIFILSLLVFIGSSGVLIKLTVVDPSVSKRAAQEAQEIYYKKTEQQDTQSPFEGLSLINDDIKAWIKIDNTVIDYPVVQATADDPTFYLDHNYKKEQSRYGSIFIDAACENGVDSKNILLHGHHMKDGQMFAGLLKFSDLGFYKENPIINFNTPEQDIKWKIFSIFKTNTRPDQGKVFNYLVTSFPDNKSFLEYMYNVKIRSLIDTGVNVTDTDQIITMSTCSYEMEDFRTVLVVRKLRAGEDEFENVSSAKKVSNPLMPEAWYQSRGVDPPQYPDFETAYKNKKIDWYF